MINLLAQATNLNPIYEVAGGSGQAKMICLVLLALGFVFIFALTKIPTRARRPIVWTFTFLPGLFYVLLWLWPKPVGLSADQVPLGMVEEVGFHLQNGTPVMGKVLQVLQNVLLFLGVYSVINIHGKRFVNKQKDWVFSAALLVSMLTMAGVGYWEHNNQELEVAKNAKDFLFDGMLQNMDAAMFSIIAFFILSAAYRAFRIRSIESTILLGTALIVMLSLMAGVEFASGEVLKNITNNDPGHFLNNFALANIRQWISQTVQAPAIRGLEWGIGIGALSMGLRLWLSLERGR